MTAHCQRILRPIFCRLFEQASADLRCIFARAGQEKIEAGLTNAYNSFVENVFNPIYKFLEDAGFTGFGKFSSAQLRVNKARNILAAARKDLKKEEKYF